MYLINKIYIGFNQINAIFKFFLWFINSVEFTTDINVYVSF